MLLAEADPRPAVEEDSDLYEVLNYLRALDYGRQWVAEGRPLNLAFLRGLHAELMHGVRGQDRHPGAFRLTHVYIGDRLSGIEEARFVPPPPEQVPPLMEDLATFAARPTATYGPLIDCGVIHYQFEAIHPFEDGNGRLGRLLIPLYLQAAGAMDRPALYLSSYFEARRETYISLLNIVSTRGAWKEWLLFFLDAVRSQAHDSRFRVQRTLDLQLRYRQLAQDVSSSRTALLAVDLIMDRIYVTVSALAKYAGATYPTARSAIDALVTAKILAPYGRVHGAQVWEARELLDQVYQ
jgi:Fic family protein